MVHCFSEVGAQKYFWEGTSWSKVVCTPKEYIVKRHDWRFPSFDWCKWTIERPSPRLHTSANSGGILGILSFGCFCHNNSSSYRFTVSFPLARNRAFAWKRPVGPSLHSLIVTWSVLEPLKVTRALNLPPFAWQPQRDVNGITFRMVVINLLSRFPAHIHSLVFSCWHHGTNMTNIC